MNYSNYLNLSLPSRDNTTDLADANVLSGNFEILDQKAKTIDGDIGQNANEIDDLRIVNSSSGNPIVLKDSAKYYFKGIKLYGKTTQDGTPTPDAPIDLVSVGDSGSYEVGVYGRNILDVTKTSTTSNGINFTINADKSITYKGTATTTFNFSFSSSFGIPKGKYKMLGGTWSISLLIPNQSAKYYTSQTFEVTEDGCKIYPYKTFTNGTVYDSTIYPMLVLESVTDETYEPCNKQTFTNTDTLRGVGDIADEKDFARGVTTKRFGISNFSDLTWQTAENYNGLFFTQNIKSINFECSHFKNTRNTNVTKNNTANTHLSNGECSAKYNDTDRIYLKFTQCQTLEEWNNWIANNDGVIVYELAEPIETPISETDLSAYRQLHTNKPNTTILSEAEMEVDYVADPKLYIDNKIAELTALTLEV